MLNIFSSVWTILITLLIFGFLITIHELGHYLVARLCKVGIREFSIGMGPAIHTWQGKHNKISLRWLPIGGYVSMVGESPDDSPEPEDEGKAGLNEKPIWQRILVVLAGPLTNVLFAFVAMSVLITVMPSNMIGSTTVAEFREQAITNKENGLQINDKIIAIDGSPVKVYNDLSYLVALRGKEPLDVTVIRGGEERLLEKISFPEIVSGGVAMGNTDFLVYQVRKDFGEVLYQSFYQPISYVKMTVESLLRSIRGEYGWEAVSGPVGVGEQIGDLIKDSEDFATTVISIVLMTVLISVSLGICNLLPLPVLDGGRFVLYIIEAIRRKPLNQKVESAINVACTLILLGFMIFVTIKDVVKLF